MNNSVPPGPPVLLLVKAPLQMFAPSPQIPLGGPEKNTGITNFAQTQTGFASS